jgi:hypothetical protein
MPKRLGRPSPDPGLGPGIELCGGDAPGLVDFTRVGKILPGQRIAPKEPPPALLQIEPTGSFGNEDLVNAWMLGEPGVGFCAQVTGQVIRNHEQLSRWIIRLDISKQGDVVLRVARGRRAASVPCHP